MEYFQVQFYGVISQSCKLFPFLILMVQFSGQYTLLIKIHIVWHCCIFLSVPKQECSVLLALYIEFAALCSLHLHVCLYSLLCIWESLFLVLQNPVLLVHYLGFCAQFSPHWILCPLFCTLNSVPLVLYAEFCALVFYVKFCSPCTLSVHWNFAPCSLHWALYFEFCYPFSTLNYVLLVCCIEFCTPYSQH